MCDRIYIIDNGVIIGENLDQVQEGTEDDIFSYTFVTYETKVYEYFKSGRQLRPRKRRRCCVAVNRFPA